MQAKSNKQGAFNMMNETRGRVPRFAYERIKEAVLGKRYKLNFIITTPAHIKKLNTIYRNKECPTDILSFPISNTEGEIYISPTETRKEAKKFDRTYENFFAYLFIHGCTHLKGHDHGAIMEDKEAQIRRKFGV